MASVELRPGDTLDIVWSSLQDTPLGQSPVELRFNFSYEEILERLQAQSKENLQRAGTKGSRISRLISLSSHALKKGVWSTGAPIDKDIVFGRLLKQLQELPPDEWSNLTVKAKKLLKELCVQGVLSVEQKFDLKEAIGSMEINLDERKPAQDSGA